MMGGKYRNALSRCQLFVGALVDKVLAEAFPWACVRCGQPGYGMDICPACIDELNWLGGRAARFNVGRARGLAALAYEGLSAELVTAVKFRGRRPVARVLGELLAIRAQELAAPAHRGAGCPVLVPVPLHRSRLRQRGFNQAELIARAAGAALGLPVRADVLHRRFATCPQTGLDRESRRTNTATAFAVRGRQAPGQVILIDDVVTTGATFRGCLRALRRVGCADVTCWAVARTLPGVRAEPALPRVCASERERRVTLRVA